MGEEVLIAVVKQETILPYDITIDLVYGDQKDLQYLDMTGYIIYDQSDFSALIEVMDVDDNEYYYIFDSVTEGDFKLVEITGTENQYLTFHKHVDEKFREKGFIK